MKFFERLQTVFSHSPKVVQSKLTLSDADKIYLAITIKHSSKLSFIYVLAYQKRADGNFNYIPNAEVMTFNRRKEADIYYETAKKGYGISANIARA